MEPLVYIILINYNGMFDTIACVDSIRAGHYKNYKVIIVDNASPDKSGEQLHILYNSDDQIEVVLNSENDGFSKGNNIGLEIAAKEKADYVLLLNNDTVVEENCLTSLVDRAEHSQSVALFSGKIHYATQRNIIWFAGGRYYRNKGTACHIGHNEVDNGQYDNVERMEFICGCCILMSLKTLQKLGVMPEEYFLYAEDLAYSLIAAEKEIPMILVPEALIYHKVSASTSKLSELSQYYVIRNRFFIIKKFHKGVKRIQAYVFSLFWCLKRIVKREFLVAVVVDAIKDFSLNRMGKKGD